MASSFDIIPLRVWSKPLQFFIKIPLKYSKSLRISSSKNPKGRLFSSFFAFFKLLFDIFFLILYKLFVTVFLSFKKLNSQSVFFSIVLYISFTSC